MLDDIIRVVDRFNIPYWSILGDYPYFYRIRILNNVRNQIVSVVDKEHLACLNKFHQNDNYNI